MILNELAKYSKIIYSHNLASNYLKLKKIIRIIHLMHNFFMEFPLLGDFI